MYADQDPRKCKIRIYRGANNKAHIIYAIVTDDESNELILSSDFKYAMECAKTFGYIFTKIEIDENI